MFCGNCGKKLPDQAVFCPNCGAKQTPEPPETSAPGASVTEFFGAPPTPPEQSPVQPAPEPEAPAEEPDLAPEAEESATAFFSAPPVGAQPVSPPESQESQEPDPLFDQDEPSGSSMTEFFSAPPVDLPNSPAPSGPILSASLRRASPGGPGGPSEPSGSGWSDGSGGSAIIGKGRSRIGLFAGLGVAAVVVLALAIGLFRLVGGAFGAKQPVFWMSEDCLMYAAKPGGKALEIFDDLSNGYASVALSENGKYAYIMAQPRSEVILYRVELGKLKADAEKNEKYIVKVDSDFNINYDAFTNASAGRISVIDTTSPDGSFHITGDGKGLYYLADGGRLHYFNGSDSEVLEKNVNYFQVSENGKRILMSQSSELCVRGTGANDSPETIADDYVTVVKTNPDFSEIFYLARNRDTGYNLYVYSKGDSEKLASKIERVLSLESRTKFAYTRYESNAFDQSSLYVHSGGEDKLISDQLETSIVTVNNGYYVYRVYDIKKGEGRLVIANNSGELGALDLDSAKHAVAKNGDLYVVDSDDDALLLYTKGSQYTDRTKLGSDVTMLLYLEGSDQIFYTTYDDDLYVVKGGKSEKIASDIESSYFIAYSDGGVLVPSGYSSSGFDLDYCAAPGKKQSLGDDVFGCCRLKGDRFLVLADYSSHGEGTLYLYKGKDRDKIADEVSGFCAFGTDEPVWNSRNF